MGLLSCGLEAFYYIDYIPQGEYNDTNTVINLPSSSAEGYSYFNNFIIFYRIYISSGIIQTGRYLIDDSSARSAINATLNSDFASLSSLTDITSTSVNTSNLENTFLNTRKYFKLTLEGIDIDAVLGSQSLGRTLEITFPPNNGIQPTLILNGISYILQRDNSEQTKLIEPKPDLYFLNHPDLYNTANVTDVLNADVATYTRTDSTPRYTYVSIYIAAKGTSLEMPPRPIYSQPTFIGIFRLAESS